MAMNQEYDCTSCGRTTARDDLMVKRAQFMTMGSGASNVRTRVVAWLCPPCLEKDPQWNLPERHKPKKPDVALDPNSEMGKMLTGEAFGG